MIYYKSKDEIRILREGGRRLALILKELALMVKPGLETAELEKVAEQLILAAGGRPAFKNYPMGGGILFPSVLCISINDEVVHGSSLPSRTLREGDIVDIDIGMEWPITAELREEYQAPVNKHSSLGGYYTDTCLTVPVGKVSTEAQQLIQVTKECLARGLKVIKPGKTINDIARAIERLAKKHNYGIVRDLVGHGVGYFAHEAPDVFNYTINPRLEENVILKPGMVIAVEPMLNLGDWQIKVADNDYTILTADGSLSAHFEHTIAITETGYEILTKA